MFVTWGRILQLLVGLRERRLDVVEETDDDNVKNDFKLIGVTENGFHFVVYQRRISIEQKATEGEFLVAVFYGS